MARLSEQEKSQLLDGAARLKKEAALGALPTREGTLFYKPDAQSRARYLTFATAASRFSRNLPPARFKGRVWKL